LTGRLLGQHALAYALIAYVSIRFHKRLRQYLLPQQSLFIFFCLLFSQTMEFVIENLQGDFQLILSFWMPVLVGTLLSPIVHIALQMVRVSGRMK
jgi:rod shape-determining protein MreD